MPLDFRTVDEDEGFSMKRFLRTVGLGVAVFLVFLMLGYYVIGPRLSFTPEGLPKLRLQADTEAQSSGASADGKAPALPKVEVYERLSPDVVASTGMGVGVREVAPFDYEEYLKRRAKVQKRQPSPSPDAGRISSEEEPLVVPDDSQPTEPNPSADAPVAPAAPLPDVEPPAVSEPSSPPPNSNVRLYRVQVGVYEQRENANAVAQTLTASGFPASIVPFQSEGQTRYRVQVLVTRDRAKAEQMKQQLESKGFTAYIAEVR